MRYYVGAIAGVLLLSPAEGFVVGGLSRPIAFVGSNASPSLRLHLKANTSPTLEEDIQDVTDMLMGRPTKTELEEISRKEEEARLAAEKARMEVGFPLHEG